MGAEGPVPPSTVATVAAIAVAKVPCPLQGLQQRWIPATSVTDWRCPSAAGQACSREDEGCPREPPVEIVFFGGKVCSVGWWVRLRLGLFRDFVNSATPEPPTNPSLSLSTHAIDMQSRSKLEGTGKMYKASALVASHQTMRGFPHTPCSRPRVLLLHETTTNRTRLRRHLRKVATITVPIVHPCYSIRT